MDDLTPDHLHLWLARWPDIAPATAEALLTPQEREAAQRFRIPEDYRRHITGRAGLRYLSGRYLARESLGLKLAFNEHGKPSWVGEAAPLCFNISHSGQWVILAFTRNIPVGVDVQHLHDRRRDISAARLRHDVHGIARRAFHPQEIAALGNAPEPEQNLLFCRLWACKEAVVKALGSGVHQGTDRFSTLPLPENGGWHTPDLRPWTAETLQLHPFAVDDNHAGALAIRHSAPLAVRHRFLTGFDLPDTP